MINHNNIPSYENMLVTTPNKQAHGSRNTGNISDNSLKNQNIKQQESILSQSVQISSSTCIKNIITLNKLNEKEMINHNNVTSYETMLVTTLYKDASMLRNNVDTVHMVNDRDLSTSKQYSKINIKPTSSSNLHNEKLNLEIKLHKDTDALKHNNNCTLTTTLENNNVVRNNTSTKILKVTPKIGKSYHAKDCRKLDKRRNRNEKNENANMTDNHNDNVETKASSESIQENPNLDCDSDKELFLPNKKNEPKVTSGSTLPSVHILKLDKHMISSKGIIPTSNNNTKYKNVYQSRYTFTSEQKNQDIMQEQSEGNSIRKYDIMPPQKVGIAGFILVSEQDIDKDKYKINVIDKSYGAKVKTESSKYFIRQPNSPKDGDINGLGNQMQQVNKVTIVKRPFRRKVPIHTLASNPLFLKRMSKVAAIGEKQEVKVFRSSIQMNQIERTNQSLETVSNSNKSVDNSHLKIEKAIVLQNLRENNSLVDTTVKKSHQSQALCLDENRSVTSIEAEIDISKFIYDKGTCLLYTSPSPRD